MRERFREGVSLAEEANSTIYLLVKSEFAESLGGIKDSREEREAETKDGSMARPNTRANQAAALIIVNV